MKDKEYLTLPGFSLLLMGLFLFTKFYAANVLKFTTENIYVAVICLYVVILVLPSIIYGKLWGKDHIATLNIRLFSPGKLIIIIMSLIVIIGLTGLIRMVQAHVFDVTNISGIRFAEYMPDWKQSSYDFICSVFSFAVIPAVLEDYVFRGVVYSGYRNEGYGLWFSVVASALLYSMMSLNFTQMTVDFAVGVILALIAAITRSVLASTLANVLYKIFVLLVEEHVFNIIKNPESIVFLVFLLGVITLLFWCVCLGEAQHILQDYGEEGIETPKYVKTEKEMPKFKNKFKKVFLSPTMIACVILYIIPAFELYKYVV